MGKMANKEWEYKKPTEAEIRRRRKSLKFRKPTAKERKEAIAAYEAFLDEMRKLHMPPCDAVQWIREDRTKDYDRT